MASQKQKPPNSDENCLVGDQTLVLYSVHLLRLLGCLAIMLLMVMEVIGLLEYIIY